MNFTYKYIQEIADNLDIGQICFINPDTMEMETANHIDSMTLSHAINILFI